VIAEFSDNASGVSDGLRKLCFEPHVTTKDDPHAGLGLAVNRGILEHFMKGRLVLISTSSSGSRFGVVIPAERGEQTEDDNAKVLFVDDEPEHIASAVRRIESYIRGVKVEQVASVAAALEKLSTEDYDLVITDLMFGADPDAGYEVLARAYALKRYTPVIVVTSHGKDVERA